MRKITIAPSILSADFARLGEQVQAVLDAGADWIHVDVMDNHFVPNLTMGPLVCEALRKYGIAAPLDVHLMIEPVNAIIPAFAKAGATYITFHPEATPSVTDTIALINDHGCKAGIVLNPNTGIEHVESVLHLIDSVMLMSVYPGFGGQAFIPDVLDKLKKVRELIDDSGRDIALEIDGGVKPDNIANIAAHGADTFVAGSAIFHSPDMHATIDMMRRQAESSRS